MAMVFAFKCQPVLEKNGWKKGKSERTDKRRNANTARANVQLCPPTISDYISVVEFARHRFQCGRDHTFKSIAIVWWCVRVRLVALVHIGLGYRSMSLCKLLMSVCVSIFQQPTDSLEFEWRGKTNGRRLPNSIAAAATTTTDGSDVHVQTHKKKR